MPIKGREKKRTESGFSGKILTKAESIIGKSFRMEPVKASEGEWKQLDISWGSGKIYESSSYTEQDNTWYLRSPVALFFFST